jgi:ABC-type nitrate/sulfonate/bicarbonate transport system permease component
MFQLDVVIAGVLVVGLTGFLMNFIISALEKHLLRWRNAFNAK